MNNLNKILNNFKSVSNVLIYPTLILDVDKKVIFVNATLKKIIKKANLNPLDIDINSILKINNCSIKLGKKQLKSKAITFFQSEQHKIIYIPIISDVDGYIGNVLVLTNNRLSVNHLAIEPNSILSKHKKKNKEKRLLFNGERYESLKEILGKIEKELILTALNKTNSKSEAIKLLGVSRRTFYYKTRKYGLE